MTRRVSFAFVLALLFSPALVPQEQQKPAQPPDEANPPEEDEAVAPEKFVLNPLESERNVKVGNFYMHKGTPAGYRAALARYERATKFNPSNAEAFFKIGEAEEKLKNRDAAKTAFQRVIDLAPDSKLAHEAKKKLDKI
ncbi:MAG: tetratricopeptide repeat protein [Acidobacteriaceae bacterium]|nr:tetratricopeptide repeat protein [Acidobacteriaceae bacterium]MBV8570483.1 tetratricopeptide repeat protein [Acidobacteriaceae bacterium]